MSDRNESPKKDRLINAWIAVGPEGKTTDVSEVADSSRGYASDIRRALESEGKGDNLSEEEIREAYDPELVEEYRDELDEDAIDGEWSFVETLREMGDEESTTEQPEQEPSGIDRQTERTPTSAESEHPSQPSSGDQPSRQPAPSQSRQRAPPGDRAPSQHPPGEPGPPSQQPQSPQGGGAGRQPSGQQPPPQQPPGQGHQTPGPGQQSPQPPQAPPQGPQQAPQGPPPQQGSQQPPQRTPPTGAGQPSQLQQGPGSIQRVIDHLSGMDEALAARQQQAEQEVQSLPPESQAQSIAVSKHNLIVEVRQSLNDILGRL